MRPEDHDLEALLDLALSAASSAGRLLIDDRPVDGDLMVDSKTSSTDVVTEMDRRSEELLQSLLLGARPRDGYLGEEGADSRGESGIVWVVDPIDGTVNYLYRNPIWAVSVAACVIDPDSPHSSAESLRAVVGVVHAPLLGETYWARTGSGAHLREIGSERRLHVRGEQRLAHALVSTGFSYKPERRSAQGDTIARLLPRVRDVRRPGSAALDICGVASGRADAYFERGTHPWDRAAAALIAREAGAVVGGLQGARESVDITVATNAALFPQLEQALLDSGVLDGPAFD